MKAPMNALPQRMQNKIVVTLGGCWEWNGSRNNRGYGQVGVGGRIRSTHRVVHEMLVGPIADGLQIDHLCRNKPCCNPDHLEVVSAKVNAERKPNSQKTHCVAGHPLAGANLIVQVRKSGLQNRSCRLCALLAAQKKREALGAGRRYDKSAHHAFLIADGERVLAEMAAERAA